MLATMRIDLHCHSEASHDCATPIAAFPARCQETGIRVQAITDHDEIWGAQRLQALAEAEHPELSVIVGEEITTLEGEIVGLFLQERIPPGLSPEETVAEVHAQGGLVLLQHGLDPLKRYRLTPAARGRIAEHIDVVESFNARISRPKWNRAAALWAQHRGLPLSGGSDAHTLRDIGSAWCETPVREVRTPADLLAALRAGQVGGNWTPPTLAFAYKTWDTFKRKLPF